MRVHINTLCGRSHVCLLFCPIFCLASRSGSESGFRCEFGLGFGKFGLDLVRYSSSGIEGFEAKCRTVVKLASWVLEYHSAAC